MAVELVQSTAQTLSFLPPVRASSATLDFYKPSNSSTAVASGAATVESWTVNISTVTDQSTIVVDSAANLNPGDTVWLESADSRGSQITIAQIDGTTITLVEPPPGTIETEDTIKPLKITFDLTAANLKDRARYYSALWTITPADGSNVEKFRQAIHVVRVQFMDACSASMAKSYLTANFPSYSVGKTEYYFEQLAQRASKRVRLLVQNTGESNYVDLMGDPEIFQMSCGLYALRMELALDGLYQGSDDLQDYIETTQRFLHQEIAEAMRGLMWVDRNDDGIVEIDEIRGAFTVRATRQ